VRATSRRRCDFRRNEERARDSGGPSLGCFPPASDSAHGTARPSGLAHVVRGILAQSPRSNPKGESPWQTCFSGCGGFTSPLAASR
jgi:hypothetical protein